MYQAADKIVGDSLSTQAEDKIKNDMTLMRELFLSTVGPDAQEPAATATSLPHPVADVTR